MNYNVRKSIELGAMGPKEKNKPFIWDPLGEHHSFWTCSHLPPSHFTVTENPFFILHNEIPHLAIFLEITYLITRMICWLWALCPHFLRAIPLKLSISPKSSLLSKIITYANLGRIVLDLGIQSMYPLMKPLLILSKSCLLLCDSSRKHKLYMHT